MASSSPLPPPAASPAAAAAWRRAGHHLHDDRGPAVATLDLDSPSLGICLAGRAAGEPAMLLGLALGGAPHLVDHWIRGGDVTAVYESNDTRQLRTLAMWRLQPASAGRQAWVLVLSAQTALLETMADVSVVSRVHGDLVLHAAGGEGRRDFVAGATGGTTAALLVRLPAEDVSRRDGQRSLLLAVHPEDRGELTASASAGLFDIGCRLFPTPLEKGVLLRSRMLAAVGPTADDTTWAAEIVEEFAASPPLLST